MNPSAKKKPASTAPSRPLKKQARASASSAQGIGTARFRLVSAAARHIERAVAAGYWLEAIVIIESILAERMEKRVQVLHKTALGPRNGLEKLKDGFANLGPLIRVLEKHEDDEPLRTILKATDDWRSARNRAAHEMAKLDAERTPFTARVEALREVAESGIAILLAYDAEERRLAHAKSRRPFPSATCPDALAPLGQERCRFCSGVPERLAHAADR